MANNTDLVGYGAPRVTGAIFIAPKGTKMPTGATDKLDAAFKHLGFVSDDGVTISEDADTSEIKAWGGKTAQVIKNAYKEEISFTPIEINPEVAKATYGKDNVEVKTESGKTVIISKHNGADMEEVAMVIEVMPNRNISGRYLAERAKLTERGDIELNGEDAQGRELKFTLLPDANGNTMVSIEEFDTALLGKTE